MVPLATITDIASFWSLLTTSWPTLASLLPRVYCPVSGWPTWPRFRNANESKVRSVPGLNRSTHVPVTPCGVSSCPRYCLTGSYDPAGMA